MGGNLRLTGRAFIPGGFVPFFLGGDSGNLWKVPFSGPPASFVLAGSIYQPVASPDYIQIAYLEFESGGSSLKICNADGTGVLTLKEGSLGGGTDWRWPDWHPSGSDIIYGTYAGDSGEIRRINPDGTGDTLIYDASPDEAHRAVYNRDGTKIAFIRGIQTTPPSSAPDDELWVIDADGSNDISVATLDSTATFGEMAVSWMHNSDVVAYHTDAAGVTHHWRVDADGTNAIEIANGDTGMTHRRCFSLDDETFYFLNFDNGAGHYTLWKAASDGSELGAETQVSPVFGVFRPPPLVFPNGRIYADGETTSGTIVTVGLHSILEDGSDYRIEYGVSSVRLESHF